MKTEILNTGSELLLGHVVNTHLSWLARELFALGLRVERQVTVPDGSVIREALAQALERSDLVIVTGGLGPTSDDVTREATAELLGRPLLPDAAVRADLDAFFTRLGRTPTENNFRQTLVPQGATVLRNDYGTAPGLVLEEKGKIVVLLPGPPRELKPMWIDQFTPWLRGRVSGPALKERCWTIVGIGESRVAEMIEEEVLKIAAFEVGYCARPGEVDFRLVASGQNIPLLDQAAALVRAKFGTAIATEDHEALETCVIRLALEKRLVIATAESCTGGLVAHRLTNVPGSSAAFGYGWVTYANEAKISQLGVTAPLFAQDGPGAVSRETALAMADGARQQAGADLAVAVTGIAGPDGGTPDKPVGTVWIALSTANGTEAEQRLFARDRETFKTMASQAALDLLRRELQKRP